MRVMIRVNDGYEKGNLIYDADRIAFQDDKLEIYLFVDTNIKYIVKIKNEKELNLIKKYLFFNGKYDFSKYETFMELDKDHIIPIAIDEKLDMVYDKEEK